jgi:hypothetical protein
LVVPTVMMTPPRARGLTVGLQVAVEYTFIMVIDTEVLIYALLFAGTQLTLITAVSAISITTATGVTSAGKGQDERK